jgi:hypothetical protein
LLTRAGWECDTRIGAFEGSGIGFGGAAGRNIGIGGIFARAHREIGGRCRPFFSGGVAGFAGASTGTLLCGCRVSFALHTISVRPRLGRIRGSPAFTRTGLIRVPGGSGPSALTRLPRLSRGALTAIFTGLGARFAPRRVSFRAAGCVGIDTASWVTRGARLRAGVARIATLSLGA